MVSSVSRWCYLLSNFEVNKENLVATIVKRNTSEQGPANAELFVITMNLGLKIIFQTKFVHWQI